MEALSLVADGGGASSGEEGGGLSTVMEEFSGVVVEEVEEAVKEEARSSAVFGLVRTGYWAHRIRSDLIPGITDPGRIQFR